MKTFDDFYSWLMRHPRAILFVIFALALVFASKIPDLKLDASGDSLVLQGDRSLEVYRKVYKEYGAADFLFVSYRPNHEDLFAPATMSKIAALKKDLEKITGVASVITYLDVPLLYSPKVTLATFSEGAHKLDDGKVDLQLARQEFLNSPVYSELITSQSQTTTAIQINLEPDNQLGSLRILRDDLQEIKDKTAAQKQALQEAEKSYEDAQYVRSQLERQLVSDVRGVLDRYRPDARIFLGGLPMILNDIVDYVRSDMIVFGSVIIALMIVQLFVLFRAARWIVLPLTTCLCTCVYMLGGLAWAGIKLTVISANFVALLLVLGLSVTIHLVVQFVEHEKDPKLNQYELVLKTMRGMFWPCFYTTTTTMVAFFSFILSDIKPLIDFGWMMTVALGVVLMLSFLLIPAGLMILSRRSYEEEADDAVIWDFTHFFASVVEKRGWLLGLSCIAFFVFSVAGIMRLEVENRFIDYFDDSTEIYQGMLEIDAELGGTLPLDIIINHKEKTFAVATSRQESGAPVSDEELDDVFGDEGNSNGVQDDFASDNASAYAVSYWFSRDGMQEIRKIHEYLDSIDETGKVLSLATLYQIVNDVAGGNVDDVQLAIIKQNLSADIDKALIRPYLSADGSQTRIYVRVKETSRTLSRSDMLKQIDKFLSEQMGYKSDQYEVTGMMVLYNNLLQSLYSSQIETLGAVFFSIMLMIAFLFRSLILSLLAIAPNILAAFFVLGAMGWLGISLDMMTITIAAITVGIGVDDTIHYIHRFRKDFSIDRNYVATMYRCHGSIGMAMAYTTVTIVSGFSMMMLSNFTPSIYFGLLTSAAMIVALMGALLLLPLLIITIKPFGK